MTRSVTEARLYVVPPSTTDRPTFSLAGDDVVAQSLDAAVGAGVGQGSLTLENPDGRYTTGDEQVRPDDQLIIEATLDTAALGMFGAGAGPAGVGPAGGGAQTRLATAIATDVSVSGVKHAATLEVSLEPYVSNRLKQRETNYAASDRPIATGDDANPGHLDAILAADAPEIQRDRIGAVDVSVDFASRKQPVGKAVKRLADLARAKTGTAVISAPRGGALLFESLADRSLTISDTLTVGSHKDLGELSAATEPPTATEIRVEGGIDDTNLIDDSQETVTTYDTVTNSSRKQYQVSVRKPEISKVDIYTRALSGSNAKVRVRLQADSGGAPVAPNDSDSDIVSATAENAPGDTGDWQTIPFGGHTLPPTGDPWLLVEADGEDGVEVGVDGGGTVAFRAYFPKPVIVSRTDPEADETFLAHERSTNNDALTSFAAADDLAQAELARQAVARTAVDATALSTRAHELRPGDLVDLDEPWANAEGLHVVTDRQQSFVGQRLETTLSFESASTYT
jgi:hypothetical protein